MILNIRGTSGSGKTHLGRALVKHYGANARIITDEDDNIFGYQLPHNLWVLGRYDDAIKGGGVDNITGRLFKRYQDHGGEGNSMDAVEAQVRKWDSTGRHVFFEGLIVTSVWGRWVKMAQELDIKFLFLDTPLQVCFERVLERSGGRVPKGWNEGKSDLEAKHSSTQSQVASIERRQGEVTRQISSLEDFHHRQSARHIPKADAAGLKYQILNYEKAFEQLMEVVEVLE